MKFEIKHRLTGAILFELETKNLKLCVEAAVKSGACLTGAFLEGACLEGADLTGAYLKNADLTNADLTGAYLKGAYLKGAYLTNADLKNACLEGACLEGAFLEGACLEGACLKNADLKGAFLKDACLKNADLKDAKNSELIKAQTEIVPIVGAFEGWKKCQSGIVVRIHIPMKARRSNATGRKCRAEYVKVLEVIGADVAYSKHDQKTEYRVGNIVRCDKWNEDRFVECGGGIHFFLTREEAEAYE